MREFNFDNKVWVGLDKLSDLLLLSVVWTLCSLPVVTAGAATAALFSAAFQLREERSGRALRSFWSAFQMQWKRATLCWFIYLAVGAVLALELVICVTHWHESIVLVVCSGFLTAALLVHVIAAAYLFAGLSRFQVSVRQSLLNAVLMTARHGASSLFLLLITATGLLLTLRFWWLCIFFPGLLVYLEVKVLEGVFQRCYSAE